MATKMTSSGSSSTRAARRSNNRGSLRLASKQPQQQPQQPLKTAPAAPASSSARTNSRTNSRTNTGTEKDDETVFEHFEKFVLQVEKKLENLEKISSEFIDIKFHQMASEIAQLKEDVFTRTLAAGETFITTIESHMGDIGDLAHNSMHARWQRGQEFYESALKAMEASHIEASLEKARDRLLSRKEMPLAWHNNPYIENGYKFCRNYAECVQSAFQIHNETCNIWTHAIAFMIMIALAFYHLPSTEEWLAASWADAVPVSIFVVAALKCLVCSVTWHTFCNIQHVHIHAKMACVDYTGIMLLITASILTVEYAALYCHPTVQAFYLTLTSICGLAGVAFTWHPLFDKMILLRITFFVSFAAAGAFAGLHAAVYEGFWPILQLYLPVFKSIAAYGLGVIVYAFRMPERFFPNTAIFNYIGMSHNLWHLAVFAGIYYHYQACLHLLRHGVSITCAV